MSCFLTQDGLAERVPRNQNRAKLLVKGEMPHIAQHQLRGTDIPNFSTCFGEHCFRKIEPENVQPGRGRRDEVFPGPTGQFKHWPAEFLQAIDPKRDIRFAAGPKAIIPATVFVNAVGHYFRVLLKRCSTWP